MNAMLTSWQKEKIRIVSLLLYVGTALLVYHKRVGWEDSGGVNWVQLLLRPDVWMGLSVAAAAVLATKWLYSFHGHTLAIKALILVPCAAILSSFIGTTVGFLRYDVAFSSFGDQVGLRLILCTALGILVYNLAIRGRRFSGRMIQLLRWAPAGSGVIAIALVAAPGLIPLIFHGSWLVEGPGLFSFGQRYQGLTSNPNMVATTSCLGMALVLPQLISGANTLRFGFWLRAAYFLTLLGVMAWSGVRATVVILVVVVIAALWLRFRLTTRGLVTIAASAVGISLLVGVTVAVLAQVGVLAQLVGRLSSSDGRLFLWGHYLGVLFRNPLGLGLGYESIVHTDQIIAGQRLPPHNTILEMAMYGGFLGVVAHLAAWFLIGRAVVRLKRLSAGVMPLDIQGLVLGWLACSTSLLFAGLIFTDYTCVLLTALLLAELRKFDSVVAAKGARS